MKPGILVCCLLFTNIACIFLSTNEDLSTVNSGSWAKKSGWQTTEVQLMGIRKSSGSTWFCLVYPLSVFVVGCVFVTSLFVSTGRGYYEDKCWKSSWERSKALWIGWSCRYLISLSRMSTYFFSFLSLYLVFSSHDKFSDNVY